jgi:hypothetical protein
MPDETTGFEPGPELDLTAHAEAEQLRERLYAAQNALVRLQNERAGIAADLQVVLRGQEWRMLNGTGEFRQAFEGLLDVAWPRAGARRAVAPSDGQPTEGAGVTEALSAAKSEALLEFAGLLDTLAGLARAKGSDGGLLDRILAPSVAEVYRNTAMLARNRARPDWAPAGEARPS